MVKTGSLWWFGRARKIKLVDLKNVYNSSTAPPKALVETVCQVGAGVLVGVRVGAEGVSWRMEI